MTTRQPRARGGATFGRSAERKVATQIFRWRRAGEAVARRAARNPLIVVPAILAQEEVQDVLVGWMAALGKATSKRPRTSLLSNINHELSQALLLAPEIVFRVVGEAINVVDTITDIAIPDQLNGLQTLTDIPEETLRDASLTMSKMARALRTGGRN